MPVLHLQVAPLQNPDRYQALAAALTRITHEVLGKREEVTAVLIDDLPAARWHVGGEPVDRPTALLRIAITQGTNSAQEKADFISHTYAELTRQLGHGKPLAPASYVIVEELPGTDWGYDGRTQLARRAAVAA